LADDEYSAHQGVEHGDRNALRVIGGTVASEMVERFLSAQYSGQPRRPRRLAKVKTIEARHSR
jgi:ribose 5-phosphate isomerase RpiB